MKIDNVPILGNLNSSLKALVVNLVLLAIVCIVLGVLIPFFPKILDVLVGALLIVSGLLLLSTAYHIYQYKKKFTKWFDK